MAETNKHYNQCVDTLMTFDINVQEMQVFLAFILKMGHDKQDILKDFWSHLEELYIPFFRNMIKSNCFCILRFLHFLSNLNQPDKTEKTYDMLENRITL